MLSKRSRLFEHEETVTEVFQICIHLICPEISYVKLDRFRKRNKIINISKTFCITFQEYNVVSDEYKRVSSANDATRQWQNGASEFQNVARKEEKDWKMIYLARQGWSGNT